MTISAVSRDEVPPEKERATENPPLFPHDQPVQRPFSHWKIVIVVLSLCAGTLLVATDITIISVAIPTIAMEFVAFADVGWYGSAYLFTVTAFQPAFGSVYRFFDAKWTYLLSIIIFEGRCFFCKAFI